jgi:integrase/recombinase XerD
VVKLPGTLWDELQRLRKGEDLEAPIFASRKGKGRLTTVQVTRIVKAAAQRVEDLDGKVADQVSPHWLRHAHASHSLDNGAPIHLVQATLGHASVATTGRYLHARPTESSGMYLKG